MLSETPSTRCERERRNRWPNVDSSPAIARRVRNQMAPAVSAVGWKVYDQYLRANGIEQGTRSYTDVVRLILGTKLGTNALMTAGQSAPASSSDGAEMPSRQP